jgi:hypothetical protein
MKVRTIGRDEAGTELWKIASEYKQYRSDLNDKDAFKLAMLSNPDLAEAYLGCPVRRDAADDVRRFLVNPHQQALRQR